MELGRDVRAKQRGDFICRDRSEVMSDPTKEYLFAKAELCAKLAKDQENQNEIAEALRNMERANRAMARIFNMEEEEEETLQERADRTNPYILRKEKEDE
jgi:hypothetical protein